MNPKQKKEMIDSLQVYLESPPLFQGKTVLLFGHCNATEELCDYLLEQKVTPLCFLDNNKEKQGNYYKNIPMYPPEYITNVQGIHSLVLIASRFFHPMTLQLRQLGYEGDIVETVEYNSFQSFSIDNMVFDQKKQRVEQGAQVFRQLQQEYSNSFFVLCPHQALGDVYWTMCYLPAYCKKHHLTSIVIVTVGHACAQVAKLFGYISVVSLEQKKMDMLLQQVVLLHENTVLIAHHNHLYSDTSFQILQHHFMEFSQYYRDIVLGLDETAICTSPLWGEALSCPEIIPKGKAVILAPYANSVVEAPEEFWVELARQYQRKGFIVFTNIISGQEVVEGTTPLKLPLTEMIAAVEWAGHFVSIRSGICDVVYSAKAEKTVVFPYCLFSTTKHKISDFFALEGWKKILLEEVSL